MKNVFSSFLLVGLLGLVLGLIACGDSGKSSDGTATPAETPETEVTAEVGEDDPPASEPASDKGITIKGTNVNVRSKADKGSEVVGQVNEGESYDQLGMSDFFETIGKKTDFWYQVDLGDGKEGWVFGAFTNQKLSSQARTDRLVFEDVGMGDYYHLVFAWSEGEGFGWKCPQYYMEPGGFCDFGYGGPHELSGYELENYDSENEFSEIVPNPEYVGKQFDVTWKVKLSNAVEGEGSMETIEMETPQILSIKLVE